LRTTAFIDVSKTDICRSPWKHLAESLGSVVLSLGTTGMR